jgi:hypothetical protein
VVENAESRTSWVRSPALPHTGGMVLWKLVNFSVPHSSTCTSEALIASIAYVL